MMSKKPGKKNMGKNNLELINIRWRKIKNKFIITNDFGRYLTINQKEFNDLVYKNKASKKLKEELISKGFIKTQMDFDDLFSRWKNSNSYLFWGPSLHILVTTLRCNHKCVYCQSQAVGISNNKTDMPINIAKKSVDIGFYSTAPVLTFEFQGGEPLYNWETVSKTIRYIREKEKNSDKKINISIVTNFSLMDEKKANFLMENEVSICTSLDGPEKLHNKNRIYTQANSYRETIKWLKYFNSMHDKQTNLSYRIFKPSALTTISSDSLKYHKEIVDEFVKNDLNTIFLRPLSPIGFAKKMWDKIGYDSKSFLKFYKDSLNYILNLNKKGIDIKEKTAIMLLNKILNAKDSGFVDLRCPCGAGIGQVAYNHNGDIYTCDEGRMVGWEGDDIFKIGTVNDSYKNIINSLTTKTCAITSNLENQFTCSRCAYRPYCGVCPVINYEAQNNIWGNNISSERCKIFMGIFDIIFELMEDKKNMEIFNLWVEDKKEITV